MKKRIYKKEDGNWYVLLSVKDKTSLKEKGPFDSPYEAWWEWLNYCASIGAN